MKNLPSLVVSLATGLLDWVIRVRSLGRVAQKVCLLARISGSFFPNFIVYNQKATDRWLVLN